MHHLAKIMFGKFEQLPYRAECACGTAGDFSDHAEAQNYLAMHLTRLQGINSAEFGRFDLGVASNTQVGESTIFGNGRESGRSGSGGGRSGR